jgi:hypothetical protein
MIFKSLGSLGCLHQKTPNKGAFRGQAILQSCVSNLVDALAKPSEIKVQALFEVLQSQPGCGWNPFATNVHRAAHLVAGGSPKSCIVNVSSSGPQHPRAPGMQQMLSIAAVHHIGWVEIGYQKKMQCLKWPKEVTQNPWFAMSWTLTDKRQSSSSTQTLAPPTTWSTAALRSFQGQLKRDDHLEHCNILMCRGCVWFCIFMYVCVLQNIILWPIGMSPNSRKVISRNVDYTVTIQRRCHNFLSISIQRSERRKNKQPGMGQYLIPKKSSISFWYPWVNIWYTNYWTHFLVIISL